MGGGGAQGELEKEVPGGGLDGVIQQITTSITGKQTPKRSRKGMGERDGE